MAILKQKNPGLVEQKSYVFKEKESRTPLRKYQYKTCIFYKNKDSKRIFFSGPWMKIVGLSKTFQQINQIAL